MKRRETGLDLIKVIMMFWIIMFHMANHSMIDLTAVPISWSWMFEAFCKLGGGVADCSFILITGYLYHNKKIKIYRILQLWFEVWFYSVGIGIICMISGVSTMTIKDIIKMIFPVTYNEYPFFSAYMILFLLIPFLNRLVQTLLIKQYQYLVWLLIVIVSIIPTFTFSSWVMTATQLPMFIVLYFWGAGIGKYGDNFILPAKLCNYCVLVITGILVWFSEVILHIIDQNPFYFVWDMNKFPVVLVAVELFILVKKIQLKGAAEKTIRVFSQSVFGVYLIHMHRVLKTPLLDILFDNTSTYGTWKIMPQVLGGALLIYIVCVCIEQLRIHIVERLSEKYIHLIAAKLEDKWEILSID